MIARFVERAVDGVAASNPLLDADLLDLLRLLLTGTLAGEDESGGRQPFPTADRPGRGQRRRGHRLLSMGAVAVRERGRRRTRSARPRRRDVPPSLHRPVRDDWPRAMSPPRPTTRSAARTSGARLAVLSEIPDRVGRNGRSLGGRTTTVTATSRADAPDRHDEWLVYQTLGRGPIPSARTGLGRDREVASGGQTTHAVGPGQTSGTRTGARVPRGGARRRRLHAELDDFVTRWSSRAGSTR